MPTISARFESWWKVGAIIAAAITIGFTAGATITSFLDLPGSVKDNTSRIVVLESRERDASRERQEIRQGIEQMTCLIVAGRRETPIEDCLRSP